MPTRCTWDPEKAKRNSRIHGISFEMATGVFGDPNHIVTENYLFQGEGEQRRQVVGATENLVLLLVVFVDRSGEEEETIHIISARKANAYEKGAYEDQFRR
jgi:uncharacterized DUF497 family protein